MSSLTINGHDLTINDRSLKWLKRKYQIGLSYVVWEIKAVSRYLTENSDGSCLTLFDRYSRESRGSGEAEPINWKGK